MFLFVFWIINFGVPQISHKVFPDFKKVKTDLETVQVYQITTFFRNSKKCIWGIFQIVLEIIAFID